jgi:uncharacterized protein
MPSTRTDVRRLPERGRYDRSSIDAILDEALICHLGLASARGPVVLPTLFARVGDEVYLHGSPANAMLRGLRKGVDACCTVTLVDGLVLARSAFHHSINYRSVVIFGRARLVDDLDEKAAVLAALVEKVMEGRSREARTPTEKELRATLVLSLPIDEASAKVRTGPPVDDEEDYGLPVWAGVLSLRTVGGPLIADPKLSVEVPGPVERDGKWISGILAPAVEPAPR